MAGKHQRTAAVAFDLITELADRLVAAGLRPEQMPSLDDALRLTWPLAKRLAKFEKTGNAAGRTAVRARETLLATAVYGYTRAPWCAWPEYRPGDWHVELVRGAPTSADYREREAA